MAGGNLLLLHKVIERPEYLRQIGQLVIGVEPAGIGQDPHHGVVQPLRLKAERRSRALEGKTVGADPDHCHRARSKAADLPEEPPLSGPQLIRRELGRGCRRARHQVGDPNAILEEKFLLPGLQEPAGKAAGVESGPEPIARPGEMMAGGGGVESGIDAREEDAKAGRDQVGHPEVDRRGELRLGRPLAG
jgi:hypothetical protein